MTTTPNVARAKATARAIERAPGCVMPDACGERAGDESMRTAKFLRQLETWKGDARLYECSPPMEVERTCGCCEHVTRIERAFVVVSACIVEGQLQTWIFESTEDGADLTANGNLPGSIVDWLDHARALRNAGYEIAE